MGIRGKWGKHNNKNSTNRDNTMSTFRDAKAYSTHRRLTYNNNRTAYTLSVSIVGYCLSSAHCLESRHVLSRESNALNCFAKIVVTVEKK